MNNLALSTTDAITSIRIRERNEEARIWVTFSNLNDNPFIEDYTEYYYYSQNFMPANQDCFANKLVFTNGTTTFTPQHTGWCSSVSSTLIKVFFDTQDSYRFVLAGFADLPFTDLLVYTNENALTGNFPIQPIAQNEAISVTSDAETGLVGFFRPTLNIPNGVLLLQFTSFVQLSSLNLQWVQLGRSYTRTPENSFNLTGGTILTTADQLSVDVPVQLTSGDRAKLENLNICVQSQECLIFTSSGLAQSFDGRPVSNTYGLQIFNILRAVQCKPVL